MNTAILEQKLSNIPEEYLNEVEVFLDFLSYRIEKSKAHPTSHKRTPDILKGDVYMSEDFDAPLEDFKEYM